MSFDWSEYLTIARFLAEDGIVATAGGARRSAVSRAYYAAYGHARSHASRNLGFVPHRRADDHERLCDHLETHRHPDEADTLRELRRWRNRCDYNDSVGALEGLVAASIAGAGEIITRLA